MLLYHSVSDTPTGTFGAFTVSRAQLAAHLDLMLEQGYQPITVRQLLDGLGHGSAAAARRWCSPSTTASPTSPPTPGRC